MTEELLKFKETKLLFLDIETASGLPKLDEDSELFDAFQWKMRDKENDELLSTEDTQALYKQRAALHPVYGQVVAITIGVITEDESIVLKTFKGEEKQLLEDFVKTAKTLQGFTTVLWNAPFDMPYMRKRFMINKLEGYLSSEQGNDSMEKPWTVNLLDLMTAWKGIAYGNEGMDEVAIAMGLPSPKDDIKGSDVSRVFHEGGIDRIATYNQKDVATLINIYRILTYKQPITDIIIREDTAPKELTLMDAIFAEQKISKTNEKKLLALTKKMDADEKEKTVELLEIALYKNPTKLTAALVKKILK